MSGKRTKALRREFREKNPTAWTNRPWVDVNGTLRGNAFRQFKRAYKATA